MLTTPFLTDLDQRAAIKGSRDPLGIQPIWTRFGRHVVGNLTTVTTSVRDFTVLLLGYHFAERVAEELGPGHELQTFIKWEQLAAYARAKVNDDLSFRGTERVRKNLADSSKVVISADPAHQILGNQKIYGLWGLYTVSARSSGLVEGDPTRLTLPARGLVDHHFLPQLTAHGVRDGNRIVESLAQSAPRLDLDGADRKLLHAIAALLGPALMPEERSLYADHLRDGGPDDATGGCQAQLAALLEHTDFTWSRSAVHALAKEARAHGHAWHPLAHRLDRIAVCEAVVAPASDLFTHMLGMHDQPVATLIARLKATWGGSLKHLPIDDARVLRTELSGSTPAVGDRWVAIAEALHSGDYGGLIELLAAQNKWVMTTRGGSAPWVGIREGRLDVRFRDEDGKLPGGAELPDLWRFPYFLDSLRGVTNTLAGT